MQSRTKGREMDVCVFIVNFYTLFVCVIASNLDETAKSVFKENVRVTEALASHIDEAEQLRDQVRRLEYENRQLRNDQELGEMLVQQKVAQSRRNKQTIRQVHIYSTCDCVAQHSRKVISYAGLLAGVLKLSFSICLSVLLFVSTIKSSSSSSELHSWQGPSRHSTTMTTANSTPPEISECIVKGCPVTDPTT